MDYIDKLFLKFSGFIVSYFILRDLAKNKSIFPGATGEANGQQNNTGVGSVGSYQSSGGSPESHGALSPVHSPPHPLSSPSQQQNGSLDDTSVMMRENDHIQCLMAFKQEPSIDHSYWLFNYY